MPGRWLIVEADGGSRGNPGPAGYGALVRDPATRRVLAERAAFLGTTTNNVAEYSGLVAGLRAAVEIDPAATIEVRLDSRLVVEQMSGRWKIKNDELRALAAKARAAAPPEQVSYTWVPRAENADADALANEAMDQQIVIVRNPIHDDPEPPTGTGPWTGSAPESEPSAPVASGGPMGFDPADSVTVVLVRHGETPMTVSGGFSGSSVPGPALSARGRDQAARAAELVYLIGRDGWGDVPDPSELLASPMVRTQETAGAIGRRLGLTPRTEPLFAECDFGEWEGLTAAEIEAGWPGELRRWHEDASLRAPGGESIEDVGVRVRAGLEAVRAGGVGRTVVIVTHSVSIRAAVGVAIGANSSAWARVRVALASVTVIQLWADGASEVSVVGAPSGA